MKNYTDIEKFIADVGNIKKCDLHLEMYIPNNYKCICSEIHEFNRSTKILAQGVFKLLLECPKHSNIVNCVKLKYPFLMIFGKPKLESTSGINLNIDEEYMFKVFINAMVKLNSR